MPCRFIYTRTCIITLAQLAKEDREVEADVNEAFSILVKFIPDGGYCCLTHALFTCWQYNPGRKAAAPGPVDGDGTKQLMKTQEIASGRGPNGRIWEQHAKPEGKGKRCQATARYAFLARVMV